MIAAFIVDPRDASGFEALLYLPKVAQFEACGNAGDDLSVFARAGSTAPLTWRGEAEEGVADTLLAKIQPHLDAAAPRG